MPSIKAIFGADASELYRVVSNGIPNAMRGLRQQMDSLFGGGKNRSTIFNVTQEKDAVREYGEWWNKTLTTQSIDAATRANRARQLIRQRHAAQERAAAVADQIALDNAVEAATRNNRARALLRERRQARVDSWREQTEAMRNGPGSFQTGGTAVGAMASGNWRSRLGVAGSMFTSVARDSAASLASGAPITQVIAQQAPQVLQALAMMKLSTVAWGAALTGVVLYGWHKITQGISEAVYKVKELAAANEQLRLKGLATRAARRLGDVYDEGVNTEANAGIDQQLAEMDQRQTEDKLKREKENLDFEKSLGGTDPEKLRRFKIANERNRLYSVIKDEEEKKRLRGNALKNQFESDFNAASQIDGKQTPEEMAQQSFKLDAIKKKYERDKQNLDAESNTTVLSTQNEIAKLNNELSLGAKKPEMMNKTGIGQMLGMTENQRLGAYGGGPAFTLVDLNKQQLQVLKDIERKLPGKGMSTRGLGVRFG